MKAVAQTGDHLTDMKANSIIERDGYEVTGYVLSKNGARCIVELSAVRWLTKDEMWSLMHPDAAPDKTPVAYMHRWPGCAWELSFADDDGKCRAEHSKAIPLVAADHECAHAPDATCNNAAPK